MYVVGNILCQVIFFFAGLGGGGGGGGGNFNVLLMNLKQKKNTSYLR